MPVIDQILLVKLWSHKGFYTMIYTNSEYMDFHPHMYKAMVLHGGFP